MQGRAEMEESMTEHRKWSGEKGEMRQELWWKEEGPYKKKKGKRKTETGIGQTQVAKG